MKDQDLENFIQPSIMENIGSRLASRIRFGVVGMSFKVAPIPVREEVANKVTLQYIGDKLADYLTEGSELVLLSTCNRVEIYFASGDIDSVADKIARIFGLRETDNNRRTYFLRDSEAVTHLFTVASGIDSLVVGESQIHSQVRDASRMAIERKMCGPYLSKLFQKAYKVGRETRESYPALSSKLRNSVSDLVAHIVSEYSRDHFHDIRPNVLLIGLGKMIKLAINSIDKEQLGSLIVAVRKPEQRIAGTDVIPVSDLAETIRSKKVDIIVAATSSKDYILTSRDLLPAIKSRENMPPLLIIDMSVPRNVDPSIPNKCENVILNNIDDLKDLIPPPTPELSEVLRQASHSIDIRAHEFMTWVDENKKITPILNSLRKRAEAIRSQELINAIGRLPGLTPEQERIIGMMSDRIMRRFLSIPTTNLRSIAKHSDQKEISELTGALSRVFSLDPNDDVPEEDLNDSNQSAQPIVHAPEEL